MHRTGGHYKALCGVQALVLKSWSREKERRGSSTHHEQKLRRHGLVMPNFEGEVVQLIREDPNSRMIRLMKSSILFSV